jgi:hypothetical protein
MQYSYEKDAAARIRALAMTRYLDPSSERIGKASAAEVAQAKAWLEAQPVLERTQIRDAVERRYCGSEKRGGTSAGNRNVITDATFRKPS